MTPFCIHSPSKPQLFAVIPAAGRSRRMGRPKLTLELGGRTVLARLAAALDHAEIDCRLIVIRKGDADLTRHAESIESLTISHPVSDPRDMRQSVQCALDELRRRFDPVDDAGWLLVPADHPCLDSRVLRTLIDCWFAPRQDPARQPEILVPTFAGKRGHPTLFRWKFADEVARLPADVGLNELLNRHAASVRELPIDSAGVLTDLDTPEDYEELKRKFEAGDG